MALNLDPIQTKYRSLPEVERCLLPACGEREAASPAKVAGHASAGLFSRGHLLCRIGPEFRGGSPETKAWLCRPRPSDPGQGSSRLLSWPERWARKLGCDWRLWVCVLGPGGSRWWRVSGRRAKGSEALPRRLPMRCGCPGSSHTCALGVTDGHPDAGPPWGRGVHTADRASLPVVLWEFNQGSSCRPFGGWIEME